MIIVKFGGGSGSIKVIAQAIGEPATNKDKKERLAEIIDNAQSDIASLCNERGCNIPANPTFPQIINGISTITHFTKPAQVTGLRSVGNHDVANVIDLYWSNPSNDKNFTGVKILYKTGSYPSSPTDGTVAYDGTGSSVILNNMTNGTTYYFRAYAYGSVDGGVVYNDQTTGAQCTGVSTLNTPSQITGLTATVGSTTSGYVRLSWSNPSDSKFKGVRILYKTGGYPTTVNDGTVIYTGTGTSVEKTGLANGTTYYFRAFAYNLSNGIYAYNTSTTGVQCSGMPFINKGQQVFTSSGTFTVPAGVNSVDVFMVSGGNGGTASRTMSNDKDEMCGGGGGGGYTKTIKGMTVTPNASFAVVIGAGGNGGDYGNLSTDVLATFGGATKFGSYTIENANPDLKPSSGGSGGGYGGTGIWQSGTLYMNYYSGKGGQDGSNGYYGKDFRKEPVLYSNGGAFGQGQRTTTRTFGESTGTLYASGGCGVYTDILSSFPGGGGFNSGNDTPSSRNGVANTGGGGGGNSFLLLNGSRRGGNGGSGIVIVRWGY